MKPVQYFTDEYLAQCRTATPKQVLTFLESYRLMQAPNDKSKLISIKVPESLLTAFRAQCDLNGLKYQTQIKQLMLDWLRLKPPG
jgi:predicted DNA binding CopG/RHH family protein